MNKYYYSQLNAGEQKYYNRILDAILVGKSSVKSPPFMNRATIAKVVKAINYDHPDLYYVDFRHLELCSAPTGVIFQICYHARSALKPILDSELEKRVARIIRIASQSDLHGEFEKCRWIHDYLVRHVRYNHEASVQPDNHPDSFGIKGVFIDGAAVCEGISKAFKYLCDRLGVEALIVHGKSSQVMFGEDMPHAWNMVRLSGNYVHVDVTWDIGMSASCKYTRYDYFCISDKWMRMDHVFESYPVCITNAFSYFERRGRLFSRGKDLGKYIDDEIRNGRTTLYFKVEAPYEKLAIIQMKIQEQLDRSILSNLWERYILEMVPNEKQMCFLYRVKKG